MTRDESCIKGVLLVRCIHVSMVLKEQKDSGIMPKGCVSPMRNANCPNERSFAVPAHKKPQARDKRKLTPRSIKQMTRDDSCIKGALLIRCIHVSMVLKEKAEN